MGYRVFPDVNRIGRPKAVTTIPILLGHYRQLQEVSAILIFIKTMLFSLPHLENIWIIVKQNSN